MFVFLIIIIGIILYKFHNSNKRPKANQNLDVQMHVVVSKYNEDTSWTKQLKYPVFIYTKENRSSKYNIPVNKGNEASAYFKYIIDHYDQLPNYVAFVHGHESDWHHKKSMLRLNDITMPENGYLNLNDPKPFTMIHYDEHNDVIINDYVDVLLTRAPKNVSKCNMNTWYKQYLYPRLGSINQYNLHNKHNKCCAQFIVSRERILQHPKSFYQKQYDFIITTDVINRWSSRYYEWTWGLIFCYKDWKK
tara:strand:+ start:22038 stop:22781 length:744 start_codon:yes stop_codon:yes gene_type:complete